jgi:hypothetical protein
VNRGHPGSIPPGGKYQCVVIEALKWRLTCAVTSTSDNRKGLPSWRGKATTTKIDFHVKISHCSLNYFRVLLNERKQQQHLEVTSVSAACPGRDVRV